MARLLPALERAEVRDEVCRSLSRARAPAMVRLWTRVLTGSPPHLRSAPATLLALSAWLAGNGALSWCALDRVEQGRGEEGLAGLVRLALERALPPSAWDATSIGGPGPVGRER